MFWLPLSGIGGQASDDIVQRIHISRQPTIHSQSTLIVGYLFEGVFMSLRNYQTCAWPLVSKRDLRYPSIASDISMIPSTPIPSAQDTSKPVAYPVRVSEKMA